MAESTVTIKRTSKDDVQQRQVIVKLDGEWVADLLYGQKITRTLSPGKHTLRVDNTWNKKTVQFEIAPGEQITFRTINRAGKFTWFLVAATGVGPMYVSVEREDGEANA